MSGDSVAFDRVADCYDQTRGLPPEAADRQTELLLAELRAAEPDNAGWPVLEIGVGTGRIAVPLAGAGIRVVGVDLSAPMLARLSAKRSAVATVRASATRLPLRAHCVRAVVACHVLHLITDWEQAVAEALRALRPGGLLLAARGRGNGGGSDLRRQILDAAGGAGAAPPVMGLDDLDGLDWFLRQRGAVIRHLPEIDNPATQSAAEFLSRVADNTYSWTWAMPEDTRRAAVAEVRAWVAENLGEPEDVRLPAEPIRWRSYRMP